MSTASRLQTVLDIEAPATVALAESLSLAMLIDPPLIRSMRLRLHPNLHAAVEADFWFSSFVESRAADGVVMDSDLANELRQRLKESGRLESAWKVVEDIHSNISPAVRIEEEVFFLAARADVKSMAKIRTHLRNAVAALVAGDRQGLGMWALRALPRMPEDVRQLEESRMLQAASKARLTGELSEIESRPEWRWLLPLAVRRTQPIGVRLFEGALELCPAAEGLHTIQVPVGQPMIVRVESGGSFETVKFETGETCRIHIGRGVVKVQTADGVLHELEPAEGIDYSPILRQHSEYYDAHHLLNMVLDAVSERPGVRIVLTSLPGMGKTALCTQLSNNAIERERLLAHHFFSQSSRLWRDPTLAARSLCAQIESTAPNWKIPDLETFERLEFLLKNYSGTRLLVIVDALDEIDPVEEKNRLMDVLSVPLPQNVAMVLSYRQSSTNDRWARIGAQVLDLDEFTKNDPDAVPGAILIGYGTPEVTEQLVHQAKGSPLSAWLLRHLHEKFPSHPFGDRDVLESVWAAIGPSSSAGTPDGPALSPIARAIALVCAMREPVPIEWLEQALGETLGSAFLDDSLGLLLSDNNRIWPRHDNVRQFVMNRHWAPPFHPHQAILEQLIPWPLPPEAPSELVEYALRYRLYHEEHDGQPSSPPDLGFIQAMLGAFGPSETATILEGADLDGTIKSTLTGLVRSNPILLRNEPARIHDLVYRRFTELGYSRERIYDVAYFSEGAPSLRPRLPSHKLQFNGGVHRGPVRGCLSITIEELISWGDDGQILLWDPRSGKGVVVADIGVPIEHGVRTDHLTDQLNAGSVVLGCRDGSLYHYVHARRSESISPTITLLNGRHHAAIHGLIQTEKTLISWSADRTIRLWRLASPTELEPIGELLGHADEVLHCAAARSDLLLVSGGADNTIRVWDTRKFQPLQVLEGHNAPVTRVRVIDDRYILSASEDTTLKLWDLETGSLIRTFSDHDLAVVDCAVARDGFFVSASLDRTAKLWSIHEPEVQTRFQDHQGAVYRCRFSGTSHVLTCSADRTLKYWSNNGQLLRTFYGHRGEVRHFLDVEEAIISCSDDGTMRRWNLESPERPGT